MYILEGNVGVGKSTFLKLLREYCPDLTAVPEPVDNWATHQHGQSLLENFYKDPTRWSYTLETLAMLSRVKDHIGNQKSHDLMRVMERSVYSGHYCFAFNGLASGCFTDVEWEVYTRWVELLVLGQCKPPQGFIYLQAAPEVCFERARKRARKGEEAMSLEYVSKIHDWHEKFMITREGVDRNIAAVPVLVLDATHDFLEDRTLARAYALKVRDFMLQNALTTKSLTGSCSFVQV